MQSFVKIISQDSFNSKYAAVLVNSNNFFAGRKQVSVDTLIGIKLPLIFAVQELNISQLAQFEWSEI